MTRYVFLPELSVGPDTDVIVNINPGTCPTLYTQWIGLGK
jgi:hypothetical protein